MAERPVDRAARRRLIAEPYEAMAARKADLEELWQSREACGMPTPEIEKVCELVVSEMSILGADIFLALAVADEVREWRSTKNAACIKFALRICAAEGVPPAPSLLEEAGKIVAISVRPNLSLGRLQQAKVRQWAYGIMGNLIAAGDDIGSASKRAAQLIALNLPKTSWLKASSLAKDYPSMWRATETDGLTREARHLAWWRGNRQHAVRDRWVEIRATLAEASGDLVGERR